MDVGIAERVVVDVRVGLVHAVGPRGHLFTEPARRVVDHVVDGLLDGVRRVAVEQVTESLRRQLRGSDLGAEVTDVARDPVVDLERVQDVATLDAAVDHLHRGPANTLAPDVVRGDVVAAGHAAAGVAVVALDAGDEDHAPAAWCGGVVAVDGCEHVVVGEVAAAVVRVVRDEHVALTELVRAEQLEGEAHRERGREHELRDADGQCGQPALRVEDRRVAFVALVEDRRRRGARDVHRHLEADGLHRAPDHLGGDLIDARRGAQPAPTSRQLHQIHVGHAGPPQTVHET